MTDSRRFSWVEPALGALFLPLPFLTQPWDNPWLRLLDVVLCALAALSGIMPRTTAVLASACLLTYLVLPADAVSVAGLAVFVNVFSAFRRGRPDRLPITIVLTALAYLTLVRHAYGNTAMEPTAAGILLLLLGLAIGVGHVSWQSRTRLAREIEEADARLAALRTSLARDLHDTVAQTLPRRHAGPHGVHAPRGDTRARHGTGADRRRLQFVGPGSAPTPPEPSRTGRGGRTRRWAAGRRRHRLDDRPGTGGAAQSQGPHPVGPGRAQPHESGSGKHLGQGHRRSSQQHDQARTRRRRVQHRDHRGCRRHPRPLHEPGDLGLRRPQGPGTHRDRGRVGLLSGPAPYADAAADGN